MTLTNSPATLSATAPPFQPTMSYSSVELESAPPTSMSYSSVELESVFHGKGWSITIHVFLSRQDASPYKLDTSQELAFRISTGTYGCDVFSLCQECQLILRNITNWKVTRDSYLLPNLPTPTHKRS